MTAREIVKALEGRWSGNSGIACCPSHDDHDPSLSVSEGQDGKLLVRCHGGCSQESVISALKARDLWPQASRSTTRRATKAKPKPAPNNAPVPDFRALFNQEPVDFWDYTDEKGRLIGYTARRPAARRSATSSATRARSCISPWRTASAASRAGCARSCKVA